MRSIWKFPLMLDDVVTVEMPRDATVLCVQVQQDVPCLWAVVNPESPKEKRQFRICGTGHKLDGKVNYIGTFQLHNGELVFHVFEYDAGKETK